MTRAAKPDALPQAIIITMATLPDVELAPNRTRTAHNWGAQSAATRQAKAAAFWELKNAWERSGYTLGDLMGIGTPWHVTWTVHWPKGVRARDCDALATIFKPWQDTFKDGLGWIQNDSPRFIRPVTYDSVPSSPQGPCIVLRIEAALKGER